MLDRPTLEEQIAVSRMAREELMKTLMPQTAPGRMDFWLHCHFLLLWQLIHWNWFNPLKKEED